MLAPVAEVRRIRHPDVRARAADRPMQQREAPVDAPRQQRRVLVVRLHHQPAALERAEVLGERERHAGSAARERGVRDGVLAQLGDVGDARILDAPDLLGMMLAIRQERRRRIDHPPIDAVGGAGGAEMRVSASILHPAQEQRRAVGEQRRAWVEDAVRRIRPLRRRQDRIRVVPGEQRFVKATVAHARSSRPDSGKVRTVENAGAVGLAHVHERHQERQRRLRALILVHAVRCSAVAASARGRVVQPAAGGDCARRTSRTRSCARSAHLRSPLTRRASRQAETMPHASTGC